MWKIVAALGGGEDQGEDIFTAADDFGEAVEMVLRLRRDEPEPTLTFARSAAHSRRSRRSRDAARGGASSTGCAICSRA